MDKAELVHLQSEIDDVIEVASFAQKELSEGKKPIASLQRLGKLLHHLGEVADEAAIGKSSILEAERLTDEILDVILGLATLDFTKTVRVGYEDSNFNAVAAGLNMLGQELQRSTVSKAYVDNILSSMSDALIVVNPDKTLKTVNEFARSLLGYTESELVGQNASLLFENEPFFLQGEKVELPQGTDEKQADLVFRSKDNKPIPMQVKGSVMQDASGNDAGIVLVARDMREMYRLIASAEAANLRLSEANASLEKEIDQRKAAEEKLQHAHDNLEKQVAERTAALSHSNSLLNQEVEERKRAEAETRAREKKYRDIFENTSVAVWEADVTEALNLLRRANQKDSTQLLREIEKDPNLAVQAVHAIKIIDINAATLHLFETQDKDGLIASFYKILEQSAVTKMTEALAAFACGAELYEGDAEFTTLSGHKKTIHFLISLQHKAEDDTYTTLINLIDISQQRELEDQLRQSQKMEAIGRLAGGVAHDFNNLLTVILNYGQMAIDEVAPSDPLHKKVEQIVECAERAASLTQQLLAFSRKQVVALKVLDLNQSIARMDKMLRRLLGEDIELINNLDPKIGLVKADTSQIEQIILNLAVNSRDAMPRGGKLVIETGNLVVSEDDTLYHQSVEPGNYVVVSITDSGDGMTEAVRQKIFEPFFTTKGLGKGTGLGLSTVYGNVKQSGGHIWVASEIGVGTTFKLFFPRVEEAPEAAKEVEAEEEGLTQGTETILVVEDEDRVREVACTILRRQGYTILEASNAGEALLLSEQHQGKIDLLLTDVVMPNMNGSQLANRVSMVRPDMKVLFMSGYTNNAITQNGILEPGTKLIQKPFTQSVLAHRIREVLDEAAA